MITLSTRNSVLISLLASPLILVGYGFVFGYPFQTEADRHSPLSDYAVEQTEQTEQIASSSDVAETPATADTAKDNEARGLRNVPERTIARAEAAQEDVQLPVCDESAFAAHQKQYEAATAKAFADYTKQYEELSELQIKGSSPARSGLMPTRPGSDLYEDEWANSFSTLKNTYTAEAELLDTQYGSKLAATGCI